MKHQTLILLSLGSSLALATCSGAPAPRYPKPPLPDADSIKVPASTRYHDAGLLRNLMIGGNYRKEWGTPVTMPVFRLGDTGMTIVELGGGQQTKSLRLKDPKGVEWVLRTVDKDVEKALPEKLRNTLAEKVVQDMISAAHPYAPLVVAHLAKAIQVPAPDPVLYYVPDDPAFGPHQSLFAHQICFLERRDPTPDWSDSKSSATVLENLAKDNRKLVLQKEVLRARLLDMLIADWDRHEDQWRWGVQDSAGMAYYYAIPRDRDQAFFQGGGLIPRVGKAVAMHHLNWFKENMKGLDQLNYKSREFDRIFLNELDQQEWEETVAVFTKSLSDAVIDAAVRKLPPAIYQVSGADITARLKSRRNDMKRAVMRYYRDIARQVQVWGTGEEEVFELEDVAGKLRVAVFLPGKNGEKGAQRYSRVFDPKITRTLFLEGLNGKDHFVIQSLPKSLPIVHLYGGGQEDVFEFKQKQHPRVMVHAGARPVDQLEVRSTGN